MATKITENGSGLSPRTLGDSTQGANMQGIWSTASQLPDFRRYVSSCITLIHSLLKPCPPAVDYCFMCYTHINKSRVYMVTVLPVSIGTLTSTAHVMKCLKKERLFCLIAFLVWFFCGFVLGVFWFVLFNYRFSWMSTLLQLN